MSRYLQPVSLVPDGSWVGRTEGPEGVVQLDPSAGGPRDPLLPRAVGRLNRELIYSVQHPSPLPRETTLILQTGGIGTGVRTLLPVQIWALSGGEPEAWDAALAAGFSVEDLLRAARRVGPPGVAN